MLEKQVEKHLKSRVEKAGGLCLKFTSPGTAGVPDRIIILNGSVCFAELKRPEGGRLSAIQKAMHERMRKAGATVAVIKNREEADAFVSSCLSSPSLSGKGNQMGTAERPLRPVPSDGSRENSDHPDGDHQGSGD